jgi:sugar lactone lactonase YvrE
MLRSIIAAFVFASLITSLATTLMMASFLLPPIYGQEEQQQNGNVYSLVKTIGSNRAGPGEFNGPTGLATDPLGNLYVVDSNNKRVQKFSSDGTFLAMWNISVTDPRSLIGIDPDSHVNLYVADFYKGGIWVLTGDNNTSSTLQQFNQEPYAKRLRNPFDIAIDPNTNELYVTAVSDSIRKYAANGTLITQFKENHKNDSGVELYHTTGVDIDSQGNVYVLAADNPLVNASFVQVFSSNGTFLGSWGGKPLKHPNDIAIDSSDTVYIRDSDSTIKVFTKNGTFLKDWGSVGIADEELTGSIGIAFDPADDNSLYLSDPENSLVKKYTKDGQYISSIGLASSADGQFEAPQEIEFDSHGNIYVADLQNYRIQKFASNGTFITKWGSYCEINAENNTSNYNYPQSFCLDPDGMQGPLESGDGQFSSPVDIAIDSNDSIYVLDGPDNMRIQKFTSNGDFINKFNVVAENKTSEPGAYVRIVGIVVDSEDNVYAAVDDAFPSIQKFSSDGTFIGGWNLPMPKTVNPLPLGEMQFLPGNMTIEEYIQSRTVSPWRIAIDSFDNIYVTAVVDTFWENYHVQKVSNNGTHLATWGQAGWCKEEFREIREMAFDSSDNLYLVDASNDRISKFSSNGTFMTLLYPEDIGIGSIVVTAMAFDREDNLFLMTGNAISVFESTNGQENNVVNRTENGTARNYYQVPLKITEGSLTYLPTHSEDAKVVCGTINASEKVAKLELLTDSIHDDQGRHNVIELVIPDEYISGIYQIKADNGQEIEFEEHQLDNSDNASLLEELDLSSNRKYTIIRFVAPERAPFIEVYATTVVPEFGSVAPAVAALAIVGVVLAVNNRFRSTK